MHDPQPHHMRLERTDSAGEEVWQCPSCGRRVLMRWNPVYARTVLEAGDERACHTGGAVHAHELPSASQADDSELHEGLRPWLKWMRESGFHQRLAAW